MNINKRRQWARCIKQSLQGGLCLIVCLLIACKPSSPPQKTSLQTAVLTREPSHKRLFFTGTVQPLRENTLTSPMDAVIETLNYHYGQAVKKDDVVVTLSSSELQRQFNDTLTDYLKAKDNFSVTQAKFTGTQNLWDAGLLSKNNFLSEKSSLDTARVTLMQATRKLSEMLEKMDDTDEETIAHLNIADFDKVRQALIGQHNRIHLKAPTSGVLLYPPKGNDEKTARLAVGSSIKAGQVFALVGDLSGISVEIDVPEIDIAKIRPGMKATITGVALGKEVLQGELVAVNAQASAANANGLPSFNALVEVKTLTENQRAMIKVGMSAAIELVIEDDGQLVIPIVAVKQENSASVVSLLAADGKRVTRPIVTGAAVADKVIVESGLNEGDTVVYGD